MRVSLSSRVSVGSFFSSRTKSRLRASVRLSLKALFGLALIIACSDSSAQPKAVAPPLTGAITGTLSAPAARPDADANMYVPQVASSSMGGISAAAGSNISGAVQGQFATASNVPTNSITTLFASNNFSNLGGAVYFDLTVASSPISVTALDINTAETVSFSNFRVYVLPGMTSVGHETNMALWTQVATGSGTGAGVDLPTHVTLSNPFSLNAGTLYGIALVADPAITHHYTNGNGSNQNYSNADLSLFLGSASNVPFTAPVFSPRVWNGTVYYTNVCTSAWQNEPPIANARRNPATVAVGSNLYAITGFNAAPDYTAVNERFNGTSWTTLAPIPVPHAQSRGTAVGTNIYVPGGFNSVSFGGPLNTMQIYNTTTNAWSAGMTLPAARSGVATAAFNGLVYVIGGYNPTGTGHNEVYHL